MAGELKYKLHLATYGLDPERMEKKFNEMSAQGWQLVQYGAFDCCYRRGEAGEYEYRALVVKDAGMEKLEYIAALAELGIEEVGSRGEVLFLRKKADGTPFELFSDLDSRIAQQKKARRYLRRGMLMSFFWGSMMLMNVLTTLMNANVIGRYAGMAAIRFSSAQIILLTASSLLLLVSIVGLVDCPRGLCRAKKKIAALEAERVVQE